jgi:hypothetical protein
MEPTCEFEKYVTDKSGLMGMLAKYGVAVIPRVIDENECEHIVEGIWDYFEHITQTWETPIKRDDKTTWREIYKLYPMHSMLFQYFNVGHAQISWDVRQNEKILDIFACLWGCTKEELLVSFDGLSFNMPPEVTRRGWNRNNTWYHTDQSYTRSGLECIQSWVTGLDVNEGDATLGIMEGSHNYHEEAGDTFGITDKSDWHKLTREQQEFYESKGCAYKKISCPKGSMVFWDSRTIHCGVEAMKGREHINLRAVIYLCYMPKNLAMPSAIKKRIKAFEELRTTSHWPHKVKLFPKNPRTYGGVLPEVTIINAPKISAIGKSLIGYESKIKQKKFKIVE